MRECVRERNLTLLNTENYTIFVCDYVFAEISNIRTVLYYDTPSDFGNYYRKLTSAGHDKLPAKIVTYFSARDFDFQNTAMDLLNRQQKLSSMVKKFRTNVMVETRGYWFSSECRRYVQLCYESLS